MNQFISQKPSSNQLDQQSKVILNRLRDKVKHFVIKDSKGEVIGDVRDLIADPDSTRYFNIIVAQDSPQTDRLLLLNSRYIAQVRTAERFLVSNLELADINHLPDYQLLHDLPDTFDNRLADPILIPEISMEKNTESVSQTDSSEVRTDQSVVQTAIRVSEQQEIQLLEEHLIIDRSKRKVGEIVVRKAIETRMVEVPVRREKLIVEQIGSPDKPLAEIDIGFGELRGIQDAGSDGFNQSPVVKGRFTSLKTVVQVLDVIARTIHYPCHKVKVAIMVDNGGLQETYHEFTSPQIAVELLGAIADKQNLNCKEIQLELVAENETVIEIYQKWFDRYNSF